MAAAAVALFKRRRFAKIFGLELAEGPERQNRIDKDKVASKANYEVPKVLLYILAGAYLL